MKAIGVVRRIEEYGTIRQKSKKPHKNTRVFADFCPIQFAKIWSFCVLLLKRGLDYIL